MTNEKDKSYVNLVAPSPPPPSLTGVISKRNFPKPSNHSAHKTKLIHVNLQV